MTRRLTAALCAALLVLFVAVPARTALNQDAAATAQVDAELSRKLAAIAGEAMMDGKPYQYLEELSDDIGGRVTGYARGRAGDCLGRGENEGDRA